MDDWFEWAKIVAGVLGAGTLGTAAKLYHDRIVAGKNTELAIKDAEIARLQMDFARAESRARSADPDTTSEQRDLGRLREQLTDLVEELARSMDVQAATLYVPIFPARDDPARDDCTDFPRGFAFVAVYNVDPAAAAAIVKMKLVETWTIVGECWSRGAVIGDNRLQTNVRHVASYDKQSGFVPVHTLLAPVHWQNRQVGVLQLFNKTRPGGGGILNPAGFDSDDRRALGNALLADNGDSGIPGKTSQFQAHRDCARFLGLQDEVNLENAAIMCVDLTRSSAIFNELALVDAARLINRFNEHVYRRVGAFFSVVEKFSGDGTLVRFHYVGLDTDTPASSPAFRALCAAADLVGDFGQFKARHWKSLVADAASEVKLRIAIALGPVISTNVGPQQFQAPTVMGHCVNRAAKMVAYAPRNRDVVLIDDHTCKALMQVERGYAATVREFRDWFEPGAVKSASLLDHQYFEVGIEPFRLSAAEMRQRSRTHAA